MRCALLLLAPLALTLASPSMAEEARHYRAAEGPDVAAELILQADGTFSYALSAGALDETSQGSWTRDGGTVTFTTEPKPVAPQFEAAEGTQDKNAAYLLVTWPNGDGIAGIDFRIGCSDGNVVEGYTQYYGWSFSDEPCDQPQWIELSEPIHRVQSPRYAIAPGLQSLRYVLLPNDMGLVDLTGATASIDGEKLLLRHPEGMIRFVEYGPG